MFVGLLTVPFHGKSLEEIIPFAAENGIRGLEVWVNHDGQHLDVANFTQQEAERIKGLLDKHGVVITSLACYENLTAAEPQERQRNIDLLMRSIDAAAMLGVDVVCTMAGMPLPGMSRLEVIEQECTKVFPPIIEHAADSHIRLALENWYGTVIPSLVHWEVLFERLPQENLGLNFDPSHLAWQGIDYLAAVHHFGKRIFHTHAKDTEIREDRLRQVGCLDPHGGWWRYVIPGLGVIRWGEYTSALRKVGYDGVLSIEHEDETFGPEEGFRVGAKYLSQFI